ncbi:stress responsive A/B barrel domain protein [Glonium stellatum]|uniref:Stress responsive A/B barrel domain protein n=1 Tax=Glonium stellatum TaxID=574774 RepID=A0A8E2EQT0_9PEZI|nr:stress responsive A/B barrel domain protein [Glonium stellatum]
MGVTHIVLFQFKPDASAEVIKDVCDRMLALKDNCIHPTSGKLYVKSSTGGTDNSIEGIQNGITHAFIVEFESAEDRDYYVRKDPAHLSFVSSIGKVVEKAQVVDFTAGVFS